MKPETLRERLMREIRAWALVFLAIVAWSFVVRWFVG
jgi:hypothetical protein